MLAIMLLLGVLTDGPTGAPAGPGGERGVPATPQSPGFTLSVPADGGAVRRLVAPPAPRVTCPIRIIEAEPGLDAAMPKAKGRIDDRIVRNDLTPCRE